ncbi:MAG: hypothetical protein ACI9YE_000890 [Psychroserpens sp.]|jgi:hypothetical protein
MKFNYQFPYKFWDYSELKKVQFDSTANDLRFSFSELDYFLDQVQGDVVLELESSQTFYRSLHRIRSIADVVVVPICLLGNKIKYTLTIVANETGNFKIAEDTEFYEKGDCFVLLDDGIINLDSDGGLTGLIKVSSTEKDEISYDLTSDWITILLPKETYEKYVIWQHDDDKTPFILASLGNACIQFALFSAKENNALQDSDWYKTIAIGIEKLGFKIDQIDESRYPDIANKFLNNCIQSMLDAAVPELDEQDTTLVS